MPRVTVLLVGSTAIVKLGGGPAAFTVRETGTVCVVYPELEARTVMDAVPVAVDPFVTIVSVEVIDPFADGVTVGPGLKPVPDATNPAGKLSTSSRTPLLNPFWL